MMIATIRILTLCALFLCAARVPAASLDAYQHTAWKAENGVPADIRSLAQTTDGWLWIGTSGGLYRFDGVHFERAAGELGHVRIHEIYAAPTGELYVGTYGDTLMVLRPDGRSGTVPGTETATVGTISTMVQDSAGSLWAIGKAIYRWDGKRWLAVDSDPVWQNTDIRSLALDSDGAIWAAHDHGVRRLARGAAAFEPVDAGGQGGSLSLAPDGGVWLFPKDGAQLRRLGTAGAGTRPVRTNPAGSRFGGLFDGSGALWKLRCPQPVCIGRAAVAPAAAPEFSARAEPWQLSGTEARQILEDREGNVWIATQRGLDRFRPSRLIRSGLPSSGTLISMAADAQGRMWAADALGATLWEVDKDGAARAVPGPAVSIVVPDRHGGVLLGGKRSIWRQQDGRRTEIPLPPGKDGQPVDRRIFVLVDDGKVLWAATPDTSLIGWVGGRWHPWTDFFPEDKLYVLAAGGLGELWIAQAGGTLLHFDNGKMTHHDAAAAGFITGIFPGPQLTVGGDGGFGVLVDGKIRMLRAANTDVLRGISGMVTTPDGDRWLNGAAGIVHVRAADWQHALAQPDSELRYELFDVIDGYPGRALVETSLHSALSADGRRLWFIGSEGVAALDVAALPRNPVQPALVFKGVATADGAPALTAPVRIPAGAERFSVQFTAPALRMPERVRFEYRLDGFDHGWQDGGTRRAADYTNVPPGAYRFFLRAYNEDGVASAGAAMLPIVVEPTLAQTLWFRALLGVVLAALAIGFYRYRVRLLTARLTGHLRVKLTERERIARALHDSFLQSLQGVLMRLDALGARTTDAAAQRDIEAIRAGANDALVEGRAQLSELRGNDNPDLDDAIVRCLQQVRETAGETRFTFMEEGTRRALHGAVAAEAADIAREALRNAAAHAGAHAVDVTLDYGRQALTVRVADNGSGLPEAVVRDGGRAGHWGLAGMRERAARIGGRLDIASRQGGGTTVTLSVPAKQAYLKS
jgi:signal transduction histidine kinase/ligand-binding sensor domain-containing protein